MPTVQRTRRFWLHQHAQACRQIELAGVAIEVLEWMGGTVAAGCVTRLKAEQQRALKTVDHAAAQLDAPFGMPHTTGGAKK